MPQSYKNFKEIPKRIVVTKIFLSSSLFDLSKIVFRLRKDLTVSSREEFK